MKTTLAPAFFGFALLLTACQAAAIDADATAKSADAYSAASHSVDYATCADGSKIGPNCGLILKLAASDDFQERFRKKVCVNKDADACETAFRHFIDAQLRDRYFAAQWDEVARQCDRHPGQCDDGVAYERKLLDSHNAAVREKYASDLDTIESERRARHAADVAATLSETNEVIGTVAVLGGATVCHSYPSVFGGEVTVCDR